jgi:hypothetical protein
MSPRRVGNRLRALVLARALRAWNAGTGILRSAAPAEPVLTAVPRRVRSASILGLTDQVAAFADEGASSCEIARRTGLARDAIALILYVRSSPRAENSTGRGTLFRADSGARGWVMDV